MAETLVPLTVVAPKNHVLLPSESATALLPGGGVVDPLDRSLLQPTIRMVANTTAMIIPFFMKRADAQLLNIRTVSILNHADVEGKQLGGTGLGGCDT